MAVTVLKRPRGHILSTTLQDALVTDDYSNQGALFDNPNHGLVDGDYIYVTSDIENYNGFWYVEQINSRFFWLREYATGSLLQWVVDGVVNYYKATSTHGWSCVHLPILYTLSNDRWPTNSIDTARTISNVIDNDGFCELTLSGDIKSSGSANELDYVKVSTGTLAGIYQIIQWVSDTNFVINVAYTAANDTALTSATIQYYYNNYNIRVRVFAGLSSSHYWTALKPYEQIVDLKLIPDDDGLVEVNINEFLKSKLKPLSNNTQLASLPNDIDSFCQFYISTAETYDETDGESVSTSTPSFTADSGNFEGVAVNSMLQFKNRYSGYLSEYLMNNSASKFLTLFDEPRLWPGYYFDIGFLLPDDGRFIKLESYYQGVLQTTSDVSIPNYSLGLYRHEISGSSIYDRIDVTLYLLLSENITWASKTTPQNNTWNSIATNGNGTLVAVSSGGSNRVMRSVDGGETWAVAAAVDANIWNCVAYGDGVFVAVASSGTNRVMRSTDDGVTWTPILVTANPWRHIAYGNGLFVAVALSGTNRIITSPDGITWANRTEPVTAAWETVGYGGGKFVALAASGTNGMYSTDGVTWIATTVISGAWNEVAYGNNTFVAVGTGVAMSSADGITWTSRTPAEANGWRGLAFGGLTFVAVSVDGTNRSMVSGDGITWSAVATSPMGNEFTEVVYDESEISFIAVSQTGTLDQVMKSQDPQLSETKTINIDSECSFQDIYLTWKNYLGGMEYWKFTAQKDYISDVESTTDSTQNIFPTWPNSYGEFADTIDRNTSRTSRDKIVVRSQNVTEDELNAIRYIVSSPLVQIMVSKNDRRTVKVSTGSFTWKRDEDKLYSIEFEISYTNTIPSQSL